MTVPFKSAVSNAAMSRMMGQNDRGVRVRMRRFTDCDASGYKKYISNVRRLYLTTLQRKERSLCTQSLTSMTW